MPAPATEPCWPWPEDTPLHQARRVANTLLKLLHDVDPLGAQIARSQIHTYGLTWLGSTLVTREPGDIVTTPEAAELLGVSEDTVRRWACTPHPDEHRAGEMLLRRAGRRGRHQTHVVQDLWQAQADYLDMLARKRDERAGVAA